jgi:hypothetical protein
MVRLVDHMVDGTSYLFGELVDLARHHRFFDWIVGEDGDPPLDIKGRNLFSGVLRRFTERNFPSGYKFVLLSATARKRYGIVPIDSV